MVDRLKMVFERLASDGDALFDDHRRFDGGQRVPLDRVGGVGQFEVLGMVEIGRAARYVDAERVQLGLLRSNGGKQVFQGHNGLSYTPN